MLAPRIRFRNANLFLKVAVRLSKDLEQNEFRNLLSTAGARCLHSEKDWRRADFRGADTLRIVHLLQRALGLKRLS